MHGLNGRAEVLSPSIANSIAIRLGAGYVVINIDVMWYNI